MSSPFLFQHSVQRCIAKWDEYKDGCAGKCRATFQGCLDTCAADYVYKKRGYWQDISTA